LSIADACFVIVGLVVGAGIFRVPSLVAANSGDGEMLWLWLGGGAVALVGALCYAELASAYPSTGGEYHFPRRAFGPAPAFLFGWARLAVMQTGSIALLAYVFGDYASELLPLGESSGALYAALAVLVFTLINVAGVREGAGAQRLLTSLAIGGLLLVALTGLALGASLLDAVAAEPASNAAAGAAPASGAIGLAMVFVLLTYGGWNAAAYVSAEMRGSRRAIVRALLASITVITVLYLLVNLGYLLALGHEGMTASSAVAADLMRRAFGAPGAAFVSLLVALCALTSINATIITGARANHALGRDFALFRPLGRWNGRADTPIVSLFAQGAIALAGLAVLVAGLPLLWLARRRADFQTTGDDDDEELDRVDRRAGGYVMERSRSRPEER
jgi:amino acid transporter